MKRVLILDTETTGLDPEKDAVIEVGAILYSVGSASALTSFSTLLAAGANPAEPINRISEAALAEAGGVLSRENAWLYVFSMAEKADAIIAHNAEFDRRFAPDPLRKGRPWICSKNDLEWPKQTALGMSLVGLALAHDLGVSHAHRALTDCDLLSRLLTRAQELGTDLGKMLARGMRPKCEAIAMVSYDEREKAKTAGFSWDPGRRVWFRRMAIEDVAALPFPVRQEALS